MNTPWTSRELGELRRHRELGAVELARHLGRSVGSVCGEAYRQRVTLRRPGERGGHLLGQPRKASLPADERDRAIADPVFIPRAAAIREGELCPDCGRRPAEVATTGLCGVCTTRFIDRLAADRGYEVETAREVVNMLADLHGAAFVAEQIDRAIVAARQRRRRDRTARRAGAMPTACAPSATRTPGGST